MTRCHSWYGRPVEARTLALPASPRFVTQGALLTVPIDSGIPRCRWHRIRVDADVPAGTGIDLAVSTTDVEPSPVGGSVGALAPAGPHPNDWWPLPRGVDDALIDQPAGRYLYLRLRLVGDGYETPVVRGIRHDFPRATSLDVLPAVYADEPESRDFGERFMALFDAALEDVDRAIDRFPALLDPGGVHADALPWLARFVALGTDQAWSVERRRTLIAAAPQLYRQRGTVAGLREAIRLVFDVVPALSEPAQGRRWGTLSDRREGLTSSARGRARLGEVRLFGRARARFRVGASALRTAPLRSYGDPEQDPFVADAYRVHVLVPPNTALDEAARERLVQLVASQVPAHVVPTVRFGASMLVVGRWSAVGIDTLVGSAPPSVLGKGLRLRRMSVVAPNRRGAHAAWRVGKTGAVGIDTIME